MTEEESIDQFRQQLSAYNKKDIETKWILEEIKIARTCAIVSIIVGFMNFAVIMFFSHVILNGGAF